MQYIFNLSKFMYLYMSKSFRAYIRMYIHYKIFLYKQCSYVKQVRTYSILPPPPHGLFLLRVASVYFVFFNYVPVPGLLPPPRWGRGGVGVWGRAGGRGRCGKGPGRMGYGKGFKGGFQGTWKPKCPNGPDCALRDQGCPNWHGRST